MGPREDTLQPELCTNGSLVTDAIINKDSATSVFAQIGGVFFRSRNREEPDAFELDRLFRSVSHTLLVSTKTAE